MIETGIFFDLIPLISPSLLPFIFLSEQDLHEIQVIQVEMYLFPLMTGHLELYGAKR
jgi:hypothetical protein